MSQKKLDAFQELAPGAEVKLDAVRRPEYGRALEDFEEGAIFQHPRGFTVDASFAQEYATTYMETNPLYLSADYARQSGFADMLVPNMLVFNIVLSLGVQNNSEKAMANLGYYDCYFLKPVYPGDTLTARTKIISVRDRGEGKPGIVHVRTLGMNQRHEVVLQYDRKIMVKPAGKKNEDLPKTESPAFPEIAPEDLDLKLPQLTLHPIAGYTGPNTYFEDFQTGDIIVHRNGRTITDEHLPWTYRVGNTHPLHYDRLYSLGLQGPMSGEPIVYGGLVFGWLNGLASRDISENAIWELGFHEGYHTQPAISGDTVGVISRVIDRQDEYLPGCGLLQIQMIGVKNIKAGEALDKFGADLFMKEGAKKKAGKEKIAEKIFEIEKKIILKKRP